MDINHTLTHSVEPIIYIGNNVEFCIDARYQPSNITHNRETRLRILSTVLEEREGGHSACQHNR